MKEVWNKIFGFKIGETVSWTDHSEKYKNGSKRLYGKVLTFIGRVDLERLIKEGHALSSFRKEYEKDDWYVIEEAGNGERWLVSSEDLKKEKYILIV